MYLHFLCRCGQSTHIAILMVWWIIYASNLHFTDWRGLYIFLQLSLEFFTEVIFVPSVHQKDWAEQGANRRGLTFPVNWYTL